MKMPSLSTVAVAAVVALAVVYLVNNSATVAGLVAKKAA